MSKWVGAAVAVLVGLGVPGAARGQTRVLENLPAETLVLPNGLRLLLAPDPLARLAEVRVEYRVGSADDPDGLHGLAHFTEHMTYAATAHTTDLLRSTFANGASAANGTTNAELTTYYEDVPPERIDAALWLESERLGYADQAVTEARVDQERPVIANELGRPTLDLGIHRAVIGALYPRWDPHAFVLEQDRDLDHIHARDIQAFLRTWYVPSNAVVAVVGRFDRDRVVEAATKYFRVIPPGEPPARPPIPPWQVTRTAVMALAFGVESQVALHWRTPSFGTADDHALDVVARLLAGTGNDVLTPSLVESGIATTAFAHQESSRAGSNFVVKATLPRIHDPQQVAGILAGSVGRLAQSISPDEMKVAKSALRASQRGALRTLAGRALRLLSLARQGVLPGAGFDWGVHSYDTIEAEDVKHAVATWLAPDRQVTEMVYAYPNVSRTRVFIDGVEQPQP